MFNLILNLCDVKLTGCSINMFKMSCESVILLSFSTFSIDVQNTGQTTLPLVKFNMSALEIAAAFLLDEEEHATRRRRVVLEHLASSSSYINRHNLQEGDNFSLDNCTEFECENWFRFQKADIPVLHAALRFPDVLTLDNGAIIDSLEALCITLRRLAYPNRLSDLAPIFNREESIISRAFHVVIEHVHDNWIHTLQLTNENTSAPKLQQYANCIEAAGAPYTHCIGFIDGTTIQVCKPEKNQQQCYNGWKRFHCLKFQSVTTPDGLLRDFYGPIEGIRHDSMMLNVSNFLERLTRIRETSGVNYFIYGDPAYPETPLIQRAAKGNLTEAQRALNMAMSSIRISVEWGFGILKQKWAFIDFSKNQKIFSNAPGNIVLAAAILTNAHTCMYGNQITKKFRISAPPLEEYLS